ncbi:hypothetical protein OROMI_028865 [Orobanche minor]
MFNSAFSPNAAELVNDLYKYLWLYCKVVVTMLLPHQNSASILQGRDHNQKIVKCGVRGDIGPACNAAGMIDRMILGVILLYRRPIYARTQQCSINPQDYGPLPPDAPSWCQAPFDPEGCLRQ